MPRSSTATQLGGVNLKLEGAAASLRAIARHRSGELAWHLHDAAERIDTARELILDARAEARTA